MTALEQLNGYLRSLERRLQFFVASRGTAVVTLLALALTVAFVAIGDHYRFAAHIVLPLRIILYFSVATALALALAVPLSKLNRRRAVHIAETKLPDFKERLLTITEGSDPANPFTELVAEDALRIAHQHPVTNFTSQPVLWASIVAASCALAVLVWLISAGPGHWGYGAALLWTGHSGTAPLYEIAVQPGNKTVRRKSDQAVTAKLLGFSSDQVNLFAKYRGSLKWEQTPMKAQPDSNGYRFQFTGLAEPVEYYVRAGASESKHFTLSVRDLPGVKRIRVALHFPTALALEDVVNDPGGDIRAVEGTDARVSILTDRPLEHGLLVMNDGSKLPLKLGDANWLTSQIRVTKDGSYHVAVVDGGEEIRLSDDYFIEARKDEPPVVKIVRPGRDPHVSPIEEVPVALEATDDFGLKGLDLHYSVNGGPEQTMPMLKSPGVKQADGKTTLYLENFKLVPGDIVSFYASAKDATHTTRTDMFMAKAEPFDYAFRQSQQSGGGGGGGAGDENSKISERQTDIIAATWNEVKGGPRDKNAAAEDAHFLSDLEGKLGEQAKTLAERMRSRELSGEGTAFSTFSKEMETASGEMGKAVGGLKAGKFQDALPSEQRALQALLRAESTFREIQVAFNQQSGGGGGGGGANRDLERMFDLELDTSKNQYETGESASAADQQQKDLDDAIQRLQALAKRQQELAAQQKQQEAFEQRWQQEMLRREAEQLRQQMKQLAQNQLSRSPQGGQQSQQQNGQQGQQQGSGQQQSGQQQGSSSSSSSQSSSPGAQSGAQQAALKQAMEALERAEDQMRKGSTDRNKAAQQEASNQLQQAQDALDRAARQQSGSSVSDFTRQAQEIAKRQKDFEDKMRERFGEGVSSPYANNPRFENRSSYFPKHTSPETDKLANEQEKNAQDLDRLQQQMQRQVQGMAATQPDDASKLRKVLSEAEQAELGTQMKKSSTWVRNGQGALAAGRQKEITEGLDQLTRSLQDAQGAMKGGIQNAQNGARDQNNSAARALAQVQQLREQLERQAQAGQRGQSSAQQGQQSGQQGQQPGSQSSSAQQAQNGQQTQGGSQRGSGRQPGTVSPAFGGGYGDDSLQQTMRSLAGIRDQYGARDRQLAADANFALGYLQHIYNTKDGELATRLDHEVLPSLARLELELSRQAGASDGARTTPGETTPEKYKDAVAEYFRKLSR